MYLLQTILNCLYFTKPLTTESRHQKNTSKYSSFLFKEKLCDKKDTRSRSKNTQRMKKGQFFIEHKIVTILQFLCALF